MFRAVAGGGRRAAGRVAGLRAHRDDQVGAYVAAAIEVEESGAEVGFPPELELVEEMQDRLDQDPALKEAFEALTPGRQRGYNLHIAGAKQPKTRLARIEKHVPRILAGKGLNDRVG